jgi:hypothetical protein
MEHIFEVKKEHLVLLKHMSVGWQNCEFGAPEIDPKRPYGNSGVIGDMIEIFGKEVKRGIFKVDLLDKEYYVTPDEDSEDMDGLESVLKKLHRETENVLQIALSTGMFKEGKYRLNHEYDSDWEYIG